MRESPASHFLLFAVAIETYPLQNPVLKCLIPIRVRYNFEFLFQRALEFFSVWGDVIGLHVRAQLISLNRTPLKTRSAAPQQSHAVYPKSRDETMQSVRRSAVFFRDRVLACPATAHRLYLDRTPCTNCNYRQFDRVALPAWVRADVGKWEYPHHVSAAEFSVDPYGIKAIDFVVRLNRWLPSRPGVILFKLGRGVLYCSRRRLRWSRSLIPRTNVSLLAA
ncbi:MAG: hypothetical protein JWM11_7799 [Planctomycetaceae bacterium]|nr:hypothetical protein [Planctomycetaceae bacterium]